MDLILVTGAPASGKTQLAVPLADQLDVPLMSKDTIKEALDGALWRGSQRDLEWSQTLGAATYEVIWTVASYFPKLVLESNFHPDSSVHLAQIRRLSTRPLEVYCACLVEEAQRRYAERASARHPVHVETALSAEVLARYDRPLGLGPVLTVDTTRPVDIDGVAAWVRSNLTDDTLVAPTSSSGPLPTGSYLGDLRAIVGSRPLILPGANVILLDDKNRVLLGRRSDYGRWALIGGIMEPGETHEQTAIREAGEEIGAEISDLELTDVYAGSQFFTVCPNGDQVYPAGAVFTARLQSRPQADGVEFSELAFFELDDLPAEMSKGARTILRRYQSGRRSETSSHSLENDS